MNNSIAVTDKSKILTEAIAGVTTFLTMSYIVVVNPAILAAPGTGMSFNGVLTATVLLSFLMTLLMGLYARLPFAVAPGMGVNAFFAFTLVIGQNLPWTIALGIVFWAGVFFVLVSATPLRVMIANAIPSQLRVAAAVGIGIFLTFIGLKNSGFIVADPATFVKMGALDLKTILAILGLLISTGLLRRKNPLAYLIGIAAVTLLAWVLGLVKTPEQLIGTPDFDSVFLKLDIWGALKLSLLPAILSLMMTDLFDSISTFVGVAHAAGMVDAHGQPKQLKEGLLVDAFATLGAGLVGTSSGTAYIESSSGIEMGGRSGLTSVFTALCFLPCFFLGSLAGMVPPYATAGVLILVGASMFRSISTLKWDKMEEVIPAFLTIILIPLTFSITQGILWGFISYVGFFIMAGRWRELKPTLVIIAMVALLLLAIEHGK
ncbi:MAG: NCS2 family permease [Bdellovibrionota bacterium]